MYVSHISRWMSVSLLVGWLIVMVGCTCPAAPSLFSDQTLVCSVKINGSVYVVQDIKVTGRIPTGGAVPVYYIWRAHRWASNPSHTLSAQECTEWLTLWRSGKAFWAIRLPTDAQVLADDRNRSGIRVLAYKQGVPEEAGHLDLQPAPSRQPFVAARLPAAEGTRWTAITGVDDGSLSCSGEALASDKWEAEFFYRADFGGDRDAGLGEQVMEYFCYEGQNAPFFFPGTSSRPRAHAGVIQADGITCVGPYFQTLSREWTWEVQTQPVHYYDGVPETIQVPYHVAKPSGAYTLDLDLQSDLAAPWGLYRGNESAPYSPLQPVDDPLTVSTDEFYLWAVASVPSTLRPGTYTTSLTVTVTQPSGVDPAHVVASTVLWLGAWQPPTVRYSLYMPWVRR